MTDKQILSGWSDSEFSINLGTPEKGSGHQKNTKVIKKHRTQLNDTSGVPIKSHDMPEESLLETPNSRRKRFSFLFIILVIGRFSTCSLNVKTVIYNCHKSISM